MNEYLVTQYSDSSEHPYDGGPEAWVIGPDNRAIKRGDFRANSKVDPIQLSDSESFNELIKGERFPRWTESVGRVECREPLLPFGHYYPRIYWKTIDQCMGCGAPPVDHRSLASLNSQLRIFRNKLDEIYRFVEPTDEQSLRVFSHEIRNLLILACTEVESQFRLILEANHLDPVGNFYSTRDFVRLDEVLRLQEYEVYDTRYPNLSRRSPFQGWDSSSPTKSLLWYDSYNAVKHHREAKFDRAALLHAIDAVYACEILRLCQFDEESEFYVQKPKPDWNTVYVSGRTLGPGKCEPWAPVDWKPSSA